MDTSVIDAGPHANPAKAAGGKRLHALAIDEPPAEVVGRINFGDLQGERSYSRVAAYSQSKLANLMFTYELQRRLSGAGTTIAVAAHPGLASTELGRNLPAIVAFSYARVSQKAAMGALPVLRAATTPAWPAASTTARADCSGPGLPKTGPLQRAIPRHRHPAPSVDKSPKS